jgi:hypothetical protein
VALGLGLPALLVLPLMCSLRGRAALVGALLLGAVTALPAWAGWSGG